MCSPLNLLQLEELALDKYPLVRELRRYLQENIADRISGLYEEEKISDTFASDLGRLGVLTCRFGAAELCLGAMCSCRLCYFYLWIQAAKRNLFECDV